jgi:translation initiation factor IF-2
VWLGGDDDIDVYATAEDLQGYPRLRFKKDRKKKRKARRGEDEGDESKKEGEEGEEEEEDACPVSFFSNMSTNEEEDMRELEDDDEMKTIENCYESLSDHGVVVCANSVGSLEAILYHLIGKGSAGGSGKQSSSTGRHSKGDPLRNKMNLGAEESVLGKFFPIPVSHHTIGKIKKVDILKAAKNHEKDKGEFAILLVFDVRVDEEMRKIAEDNEVVIFEERIIYHLFDRLVEHLQARQDALKEQYKNRIVFPGLANINPAYIFHNTQPLIFGITVARGRLQRGVRVIIRKTDVEEQERGAEDNSHILHIGQIESIEVNHESVDVANQGDECAVKIAPMGEEQSRVTVGRSFDPRSAQLVTVISRDSIDILKDYFQDEMEEEDWRLVIELKRLFGII